MRRLVAWKFSVLCCILGAVLVFSLNLGALIWATTPKHVDNDGAVADNSGIITVRQGTTETECSSLKSMNSWLHLLINVLSTVLLASSNFCMQCVSAPSRADVDKAHDRGDYLDIGVPSIHNLYRINFRRVAIWLMLGLSSLPLHLFYNSAVVMSTSSNNYVVFSVSQAFATASNISGYHLENHSGVTYSGSGTSALNTSNKTIAQVAENLLQASQNGTLIKLTAADCIRKYLDTFQSDYRNLLLVTNNDTRTVKYAEARYYESQACRTEQAFAWICAYATEYTTGFMDYCSAICDESSIRAKMLDAADANTWAPLGDSVQYCLTEPSQARCELQFATGIMVAVVVLNLIKALLMATTFFFAFRKDEDPLLSLGDALASFLDAPDPSTTQKSLLSAQTYHKIENRDLLARDPRHPIGATYSGHAYRWSKAVSGRRWAFSILAYVVGLATALGFLGTGISVMTGDKNISSLARLGFGAVNGQTIILNDTRPTGASALVQKALLANVAQLILSLLYFTYNALFTAMLSAREWDTYAVRRQALRITSSKPAGAQRDSYFLQLPYRWALPLMVVSLVLHWLVSQSIFVVDVTMLNYFGSPFQTSSNNLGQLLTCGYSPIAIITFTVIAGIAIIFVIGVGFRKFRSAIPVTRSNSFVISAACHLPTSSRKQASERPSRNILQWGELMSPDPDDVSEARMLPRPEPSPLGLITPNKSPRYENHYGYFAPTGTGDEGESTIALLPLGELVDTQTRSRRCGFSDGEIQTPTAGETYM